MWNPISRTVTGAMTLGLVAILAGCNSSGLSPRETRGHDYATYASALPETASYALGMYQPAASGTADSTSAPAQLTMPATIAVAQVGELAPPSSMLDRLRHHLDTFASVQAIPGIESPRYGDSRTAASPYFHGHFRSTCPPADSDTSWTRTQDRQNARDQIQRMRALAHEVGAKYLFLYGGLVDRSTTTTPLTLANLTIVGMFVVPSEKIEARATAAGSLIDVETGRVILVASADAQKQTLSPSIARDGDEIKLLSSLRDDVTTALADHLINQIKDRAGEKPSAMGG